MELFYDYDSDVARIISEIRKYEQGQRDTPLQAKTGMLNRFTKKFESVDVDVLAFDAESKKVQTRNRVNHGELQNRLGDRHHEVALSPADGV